jgi:hypothetical protein
MDCFRFKLNCIWIVNFIYKQTLLVMFTCYWTNPELTIQSSGWAANGFHVSSSPGVQWDITARKQWHHVDIWDVYHWQSRYNQLRNERSMMTPTLCTKLITHTALACIIPTRREAMQCVGDRADDNQGRWRHTIAVCTSYVYNWLICIWIGLVYNRWIEYQYSDHGTYNIDFVTVAESLAKY